MLPTVALIVSLVVSLLALVSSLLLAGRVFFRTEAKTEELTRMSAGHDGKIAALDAIASEGKSAHGILAAKHEGLAATVAQKASVESVVSIRESQEAFRREMQAGFQRVDAGFERIHGELAALRKEQ